MKYSCRRTYRAAEATVIGALVAMTLSAVQGAEIESFPTVRPIGKLRVSPPFSFDKKKTRRSVSGIACKPIGSSRLCLVVFDEGTKAQFAGVHPKRLEPVGPLIELTGTGGELDAEGAAVEDGFFYVTGSHSVKRESCKPNPASHMLVRFQAKPLTGPASRIETSDLSKTDRLWDLMLLDPYLRSHADGCLGTGSGSSTEQLAHRPGLNIEGLAVIGGRLYVGFRGPSEDGLAPIFSVDAKKLFDGGDAVPQLFRLPLGGNVGIRDMVATRNSLLLLVGPDDHDQGADARWKIAEWKPGKAGVTTAKPRMLATLDIRREDIGDACFEALKPEAIAILDESASRYQVVVLSDGVCDGGPLLFDIPK